MNRNTPTIATIKKIINGGYGLSRTQNGKTLMIQHSLPGEKLEYQIVERQKHLEYGIASKISEPHEQRITAPCPYYTKCGGCNLQHTDYQTQCSLKNQILTDLFERSPALAVRDLAGIMKPILPSPQQFGYRQRIRLKIGRNNVIGFNRFRSHDIIPVSRCLLASETINTTLEHLPEYASFQALASVSEELDIVLNPGNSSICLIFSLTRKPRPTDRKNCRALATERGSSTRIFLSGRNFSTEGPFGSEDEDSDNLLHMTFDLTEPLTLFWEAGGFCQVNINQNYNLVSLVIELCDPLIKDHILDLYCGMGNFALPLARKAHHVHGIESQGSAIRSCRYNSKYNHCSNTTFSKSDVLSGCRLLVASGERFDTIVCDPPRQGMVNMAPLLSRLCKNRVVYISCDPSTLCRDLAALQDEGFTVTRIQPVDMFPQTHHIETVTVLQKNG